MSSPCHIEMWLTEGELNQEKKKAAGKKKAGATGAGIEKATTSKRVKTSTAAAH